MPAGGSRYISLDAKDPPFDNINLRKAVIANTDRNALRLTRGGAILGDIANGWIPPNIPGFNEAGGLKQNTNLDFLASPTGDPAVAKKYMLAAKKQDPSLPIDASGKWTGSEKMLTVADNADPGKKTAEVFQGQIASLGFNLNLRIVAHDTMYTKFCQVPKSKVMVCRTSGGSRTSPTRSRCSTPRSTETTSSPCGNVNYGQLDDPAINNEDEGSGVDPDGASATGVGEVSHMIAAQAPGDPVHLRQERHALGDERPDGAEQLLHVARLQLHLAEVGGRDGRCRVPTPEHRSRRARRGGAASR